MKLLMVLCLVTLVVAAPPSRVRNYDNNDVQLLSYKIDNGEKSYRYSFSQSDGTEQEQQGEFRSDGVYVVKGSFSWISPNGVRYTIRYISDDNGYQPEIEEAPGYQPDFVNTLFG